MRLVEEIAHAAPEFGLTLRGAPVAFKFNMMAYKTRGFETILWANSSYGPCLAWFERMFANAPDDLAASEYKLMVELKMGLLKFIDDKTLDDIDPTYLIARPERSRIEQTQGSGCMHITDLRITTLRAFQRYIGVFTLACAQGYGHQMFPRVDKQVGQFGPDWHTDDMGFTENHFRTSLVDDKSNDHFQVPVYEPGVFAMPTEVTAMIQSTEDLFCSRLWAMSGRVVGVLRCQV